MPVLNKDLSPPVNTLGVGYPMELNILRNGRIPTFWEDNQVMDDETFEYSLSSGMVANTPIHVPKVVRFIYAFDKHDVYGHSGTPDPGGGGGSGTTVRWTVVQIVNLQPPSDFYQFRIYWEKTGDVQVPEQVSYARTHPPSDPGAFAGRVLELPYGDIPNYSNDGG